MIGGRWSSREVSNGLLRTSTEGYTGVVWGGEMFKPLQTDINSVPFGAVARCSSADRFCNVCYYMVLLADTYP